MSDNELTTEEKKKAVNYQDLKYVKKYIDDNHYKKEEVIATIESTVSEEVDKAVDETCYTRGDADNTFYKKTDAVTNAVNAENAANAVNATNAESATYATYASADTTKGTIEERLTKLGSVISRKFIYAYSPVYNGIGTNVEKDTIYRQGNYVMLPELILKCQNSEDTIPVDYISGTIPEEYRPKEKIVGIAKLYNTYGLYEGVHTEFPSYGMYCEFVIEPDGHWETRYMSSSSTLPLALPVLVLKNLGWEAANPIN